MIFFDPFTKPYIRQYHQLSNILFSHFYIVTWCILYIARTIFVLCNNTTDVSNQTKTTYKVYVFSHNFVRLSNCLCRPYETELMALITSKTKIKSCCIGKLQKLMDFEGLWYTDAKIGFFPSPILFMFSHIVYECFIYPYGW